MYDGAGQRPQAPLFCMCILIICMSHFYSICLICTDIFLVKEEGN